MEPPSTETPAGAAPCQGQPGSDWSTVLFDLRRSVSNLVLYVLESMPLPPVPAAPPALLTPPAAAPPCNDPAGLLQEAWFLPSPPTPLPTVPLPTVPLPKNTLSKRKPPKAPSSSKAAAVVGPNANAGAALDALVRETLL